MSRGRFSRAAMRPTLPRMAEWRERWLVLPRWGSLHRVAAITWDDDDRIAGYGVTACSRFGRLRMPGVLSRMELPRCPTCCTVAGVERGNGAPFNQGVDA